MHPNHGETKKKLAHEIAVANGIDAVLTQTGKMEFAIEDNGRSSERAGTQWENIYSNKTIIETLPVAFKCLDLPQQVMRKRNRLGTLQMRVTWHHDIEVFFRQIEQRSEEHTSELQSRGHLVCRLLLEKK